MSSQFAHLFDSPLAVIAVATVTMMVTLAMVALVVKVALSRVDVAIYRRTPGSTYLSRENVRPMYVSATDDEFASIVATSLAH